MLMILAAVLGFVTITSLGFAFVGGDDSSSRAVKRAQGFGQRSPQTPAKRAAAKKEFDDRIDTLKKSMEEITKLNAQIEKPELSKDAKDAVLKERETKVAEARNLDKEVNDFKGTRERQLQEQFLRMRKDIIDDIMKVVTARVSSAGYDLVFDKSGLSMGQIPVVVYSRDDMDFSKDIIDKLNANAPKVKPAAQ